MQQGQGLQNNINYPHRLDVYINVEPSPGIFSRIVNNMKGFSLAEKIAVVASSLLLGSAIIIGSIVMKKASLFVLIPSILTPPIAMYLISDLVRAVKIFLRDMRGIGPG